MSDPFIVVAIQASILLGVSMIVVCYVICGLVAGTWALVGYAYKHSRILLQHYKHPELATDALPASYRKVKVAYK